MGKGSLKWLIVLAVVIFAGGIYYQQRKPLPAGLSLAGKVDRVPNESVIFLADRTYVDQTGTRQAEQQIFNEVIRLIRQAEQYILVDMFLYNSFQGEPPELQRALASELTEALVAKKQANPRIKMTVVSDPINTVYGGDVAAHWERLEQQGIPVVITDLVKLRDSNPAYSALWRAVVQWWGNTTSSGWLPHPFDAEGKKVTIRSWLALLNFKANHRKLIVADQPLGNGRTGMATVVMSANPHDGSSAHGNVALKVNDKLWRQATASEQVVGTFSGEEIEGFDGQAADREGAVTVQLLTEGAIRQKILELINQTKPGEAIDMTIFYLSDRPVINSLIEAADRGVMIRIILDPNRDAFGHTKNGIPNRPVAHELIKQTEGKIKIRWCETHGEQCHSKMTLFKMGDNHLLLLGSANLTRRNIGNYNLETNVLVGARERFDAWSQAAEFFEEMWTNGGGKIYTTDYPTYADDSWWKTALYRVQELTGLSSF